MNLVTWISLLLAANIKAASWAHMLHTVMHNNSQPAAAAAAQISQAQQFQPAPGTWVTPSLASSGHRPGTLFASYLPDNHINRS